MTDIRIKKKGRKVALGIYNSKFDVEGATEMLRNKGFDSGDISVLMPTPQSLKNFALEKSAKVPDGSSVGATAGTILDGGGGWLVGVGALAIPGVGPLVAVGPIMAALAGLGASGTVGGIAGALIGMGFPESEAKRYEGLVKDGGILLSVHAANSDLVKMATEVLENSGAQDIAVTSEKASESFASSPTYRTEEEKLAARARLH